MEINVFKLCSGLKFLGYLMILLVAAIIAVSYHAIVIVTCGPQLLRGGAHSVLAFAIIMIFHLLLIMLLWSYYMVVFKDPGSVPENWRAVLPEEALEAGSSLNDRPDCVVDTDGLDRRVFCNYCQNGKPPRCHHCSVCQRCVLKMDHHCVWVVNCVGARNYKFFLLFLLYTFMVTTMDTLVLLPAFINFFGEAKDHSSSPGDLAVIFLAFVLNLAFALSLLCFLVMHASLLSSNTTSIEVYEKRGAARWKYDLGRKKNFEQVIPVVLLYPDLYLSCFCIVPGERMSLVWKTINNFNSQFICANLQFFTR
ncbi:protein S-acyltransferase [Salix suchowensis]|uniref:S-acyltransferase n=1 Tax=Salix koriyanagi TaxID=2511006 RepID=A0A9Q0U477_9ROSI|nr:protein S-acyltransferase [Salix suchowensis]KAJ6723152.1 ZINC FINGER DHHC DOMAIN CONTAINING PROTEIN [Salix koriyanagi]